ncbi:MAG: 4-demethylwyosine synthase TYW1 [Candidatus Woesearchaeota archaeon]|nr:4-demethylwyosine synthase TYW1 [Candidatus Woesearchaeota archaeon]
MTSIPILKGPAQINEAQKKEFEKQGYRVVGTHSIVKVCEWTRKAIRGHDTCYKCQFYGINSWRCVEMSPTFFCDHRCIFCWRNTHYSTPAWIGPIDEPETIIEGCIKAWQRMLCGFGGSEKSDKKRYAEATQLQPLHFAISLTGEPTFYPKLPELIDCLTKKGISSFLVTNGTIPSMIKKLIKTPPTQLYVSVYGPDEETYKKTAMPLPKDGWASLQETLELLSEFPRTTIRLTLTKNWNMINPEGYAKLLKDIAVDFIEIKGYMWVGHSTKRLNPTDMPTHKELQEFAQKFCDASGFKIIDNKELSRVILLAKKERPDRIMQF